MRTPVPYLYRVQRRPKAGRTRWSLAVVPPYGAPKQLTTYRTLRSALDSARILAIGGGMVEVRA